MLDISVELRVIWLMVVFVAGPCVVNYATVRSYGGRGIAVTGFFSGVFLVGGVASARFGAAGLYSPSPRCCSSVSDRESHP